MIDRLTRGLALFSLALGIVQLLAPRRLLSAIGLEPRGARILLTRLVGLREIGGGMPLLATGDARLVAARVAGDAIDLVLLGLAMRAADARRRRVLAATAAVAGITAVDVATTVIGLRRDGSREQRVVRAITVGRPPSEVYGFWRRLENLPTFMAHLDSVSEIDGRTSHWVAKAPTGTVEWDAQLTADEPDRLIGWRSLAGADVDNGGVVRFVPVGDGATEVRVEMWYAPPAGGIGAMVAKLLGEEPSQQAADDLRRLKQVLEVGEVVVSDATAGGERLRQHPAQPRTDVGRSRALVVRGDPETGWPPPSGRVAFEAGQETVNA